MKELMIIILFLLQISNPYGITS